MQGLPVQTSVRSSLVVLALAAAHAHAQDPIYTLPGTFGGDNWGSAVAVVGDVDGDGSEDFAVGSKFADHQIFFPFTVLYDDVGKVKVHSGATGNLLWSKIGSLAGGDDFGAVIAGAGDVNGDGRADVLVSAPRATGPAVRGGAVYLYSGADGALLRTLFGLQTDAHFGAALAAGDIDGDGSPDGIVGSPQANIDGSHGSPLQEGRVLIFRLSDGGQIGNWPGGLYVAGPAGTETYDRVEWGRSVAFLGDIDRDGYGEIAVGAPITSKLASASTPYLAQCGFVRALEPATDVYGGDHASGADGDQLGACLAAVSSVDAFEAGFLAGAPGSGGGKGAVHVFQIKAAPIFGPSLTLSIEGFIAGSSLVPLGTRCAAPGDMNGDASPDYVFGSPLADTLAGGFPPTIHHDVGVVQVYSGKDGALLRTITGKLAGDKLGDAVAGGRLSGGWLTDIVIGATGVDTPANNAGAAYVYETIACQESASVSYYGQGLAGTLGAPFLTATAKPVLGTSLNLVTTNSSAQSTTGFLVVGYAEAALPLFGGTLLVNPATHIAYPLPSTGSTLTWFLSADAPWCGLDVHLQSLQIDPGAPQGLSFTRGVKMHVGI